MQTQVTVKRLTGAIGAEVKGVDLNRPLDDGTFATIHQAFLDHYVLVFRVQFLDPAAQTIFTRRWGEVLHAPYLKQLEMPDHPDVAENINCGKAYAFTTEHGTPTCLLCLRPRHMQFWRRKFCPKRVATPGLPTSTWRTKRYPTA